MLAIVYHSRRFSYFSRSSDGFMLHVVSMGNRIILASSALDHICTFPITLCLSPQGLCTDDHPLYHISLGYSTFRLIQQSLWGCSIPHLLLHHDGLSFCLLLLCECSHKLMKFVLVPIITFCQKHVVIGKALL